MQGYANWGGLVKELGCQIGNPFLIPQTATFCIAMDAKRNSSFAARIKKGVRNMRSTFNILFYVNKSKEKGVTTRLSVSGRVPWCCACDG